MNKLIVLVMCILVLKGVAQQSLNSSGINIPQTSFGSQSISIGQVFYNLTKNNSNYNNEGVQQPKLIVTMPTGINQKGNTYNCTIYPNPTFDKIIITTNTIEHNTMFEITDATGKVVLTNNLTKNTEEISMLDYPVGLYHITIYTVTNRTTYTIIKN